jgi:DNA-binding transcriptional MerR regulator/methylmalonyl-CoA mutase cobalamin-binding subunit
MSDEKRYAIGYVSRRTGLSAHTIRAWERRYKAVVPGRSDGNQRLYSENDVRRLVLLQKAVEAGNSISRAVGLSSSELRELVSGQRPRSSPETTPAASAAAESDPDDHVNACLSAALNLDPAALENALNRAAVSLTRPRLINAVIGPLFSRIGEMWRNGQMKIVNEHMASTITRAFLWDLLKSVSVSATAPRIVVATPAGNWHELGALAIALTAAETGWNAVYIGPNLPAEEIAALAQRVGAHAVALSVTHGIDENRWIHEIKRLDTYLGKEITLFVGGRAAEIPVLAAGNSKVRFMADLESFRSALESLTSGQGEDD